MKQSIALGLTMSLLIVLARAENPEHWPGWRGTNGNGIAPADAQPPIKWDEKTISNGKSSCLAKEVPRQWCGAIRYLS